MTWWTLLLVPGLACLAVAGWQWRRLLRDRREEREALEYLVLMALHRGGPQYGDSSLTALNAAVKRLEKEGRVASEMHYSRDGKASRLYRLVPEPEPPWRPLPPQRVAPPDEPGGAA